MKKIFIYLCLTAIVFVFIPTETYALGQMSEPIVIKNALRGETIQDEITAVNSDNEQILIAFSAEGEIMEWVEFYNPADLNVMISTSTIEAQGVVHVAVFFNIPTDIANGEYSGKLSVTNIPDSSTSTESSAAVQQKIDREVSITISDQEVINIDGTSVIPETYDFAAGHPLNVRVIYDNQGNIGVSPQIRFKITKDGKSVYDMIYPYPEGEKAVNPKSQHEISSISIPTAGWTEGDYQAQLIFSRGEEELAEKSFRFSVGPENSSLFSGLFIQISNNIIWILLILAVIAVYFGSKTKIMKKI